MTSACARAHSRVCSTSARAAFVELGRLVPRLLEQPGALRLGVAELLARVAVGLREDLARLVAGRVQDLAPLALGLLADARDLGLALLELHLRLANLLLGLADLLGGGLLRVALDRVRELGGRADEVQRVHADRVARRLGDRATRRGLQHAQLRLERGHMPAEGVEGLLDLARGRSPRPRAASPRAAAAA